MNITIEELISYMKKNLIDISKLFTDLFSELSKNEKYFRKRYKRSVQKMYEKRFWFIFKLLDIDLKTKVKSLRNNKAIKPSDIENLENELTETKRGLIAFLEKFAEIKDSSENDNELLADCSSFETERISDEKIVEELEKQNEAKSGKKTASPLSPDL